MKIHRFQELLALNADFGHVIRGLERMRRHPTYRKETIRCARPTYRARKWKRIGSSSTSLTAWSRTIRLRRTYFCATTTKTLGRSRIRG